MSSALLQPPPERDLPPGRHASMRDEVLRQINGTERRKPYSPRMSMLRRRVLPLVAAAAVLLVIGASVGVLIASHREKPLPPAEHPDRATIAPTVPGFTSAALDALRATCIAKMKTEDEGRTGFGRPAVEDEIDLASLHIYNVVVDQYGAMALLYARDGQGGCNWWKGTTGRTPALSAPPDSSGYGAHDPAWLPGVITVDSSNGSSGSGPDYTRWGGRVTADVTRVEVTDRGQTVSVPVVNGTYIATIGYDDQKTRQSDTHFRAFDRANTLVGEYKAPSSDDSYCLVTPDGEQIDGRKQKDLSHCEKALPWR